MPAGPVHQDNGVGIALHTTADFVEMLLHGMGICPRHHQRRADAAGLAAAAAALGYDGLVQPLVAEIRTFGELSLTFLGDEFSHAAVKRAREGSILIHAEHGGSTAPFAPSCEQVQVARDVLAMLPERADYARVDLVPAASGAVLMEVELIEPELFVLHGEGAAVRYARFLQRLAQR